MHDDAFDRLDDRHVRRNWHVDDVGDDVGRCVRGRREPAPVLLRELLDVRRLLQRSLNVLRGSQRWHMRQRRTVGIDRASATTLSCSCRRVGLDLVGVQRVVVLHPVDDGRIAAAAARHFSRFTTPRRAATFALKGARYRLQP